jgi:hypothetical protein
MPRALLTATLLAAMLAGCSPDTPPPAPAPAQSIAIHVLSARPDMISGGDALVAITTSGVPLNTLQVALEGRDISELFALDPRDNSLKALVTGLGEGPNVLVAMDGAGSARSQITLLNHPASGPIFSGPPLQPFVCTAAEQGFGEPLDADCATVTQIHHFYRTQAGDFVKISDITAPYPDDLAYTEFRPGERVPFVVRVESGTRNRALYHIAVLDDPRRTYGEWDSVRSWNQRLAFSYGGGCGTQYNQGSRALESVLDATLLGTGFAHVVSSFMVMGHQCNDVLAAETTMLLKEHFIEQYGEPVWSLGLGEAGGAALQLLIAQNYPGLLDGLLPGMSYSDAFSMRNAVTDCRLLQRYFEQSSLSWSPEQRQAVEGFAPGTCAAWADTPADVIVADKGCGVDEALVYHPERNPGGARCTMFDTNVASVGRDPTSGFAHQVLDNRGVQYGLQALQDGRIGAEAFVELNEQVGGVDRDGRWMPQRTQAQTEAVALAYRSGRVNRGSGALASIPILHYRAYTDSQGDVRDFLRDLQIRERLRWANGHSDNQTIWVQADTLPYEPLRTLALQTMTQWLDALQAQDPQAPPLTRVSRARPASAVDACWTAAGERIDEALDLAAPGQCLALYPVHASPRLAAGGEFAEDVIVCARRPLERGAYPLNFSDAQWARLQTVFAQGVCDASQPGEGAQRMEGPWLRLPL